MRELSLFTGAGGGVLGSLLLGHRVVGYVEFEGYPQAVLASHVRDGDLDPAPIFGDVRAFARHHARRFAGRVDLVSAGFPCQPFSVAGAGWAEEDARNMWPATEAVLRVVRPPIVFLENVPGLLAKRYFGRVLGDLAALGFDAEWTVLGAHDVGAPHRRDRLWILAFSDTGRELLRNQPEPEPRRIGARIARDDSSAGVLADASRGGLGEHGRASGSGGHPHERGTALPDSDWLGRSGPRGQAGWRTEPADGTPILADADNLRELQPGGPLADERGRPCDGGQPGNVEHPPRPRLEGGGKGLSRCGRCGEDAGQPESGLGGGTHGVADRLEWPASRGEWPSRGDQHAWEPPRVLPRGARSENRRPRLRAIGNGQVPACVVAAWRELVARVLGEG